MTAGIALRGDFEAATLRGLARRSKTSGMAHRLLALAAIYDGGSRCGGRTNPIKLLLKSVWRRDGVDACMARTKKAGDPVFRASENASM